MTLLNENIISTFSASLRSIGTAVTLASVGVYLHRQGIVEGEGKRTLARISQQVTFPLFLFTKIIYCNQDWSENPCPSVARSLDDVWMLLFWPIYVVGCGFLVGALVAWICRTPSDKVRSVLAACGFSNSTGLPITLLTVVHTNFPTTSDLGRIDPTLFLSVYLLLYPVLQWGIGGWLLAPKEDKQTSAHAVEMAHNHERPSLTMAVSESLRHNVLNTPEASRYFSNRKGLSSADEGLYISTIDLAHLADQRENQDHEDEGDQKDEDISESGSLLQQSPSLQRPPPPPPSRSSEEQALLVNQSLTSGDILYHESNLETLKKVAAQCLQPPVVGAICGLLTAVTPLRGIFVDLIDRSGKAPLQWLFDGLYSVGLTAVPINMMILGCNLSASHTSIVNKEHSMGLFPMKTMVGIVIGKLVVLPFIGILSVIFLKHYVLTVPDEIDESFYLVLMIVFLTPTANNVMVMVELSGADTKEGIARAIGLQYLVAPITLSLTMTIAIGLASKWS